METKDIDATIQTEMLDLNRNEQQAVYATTLEYLKILEGSGSKRTKGALRITDALQNLAPASLINLLCLLKQFPEGRKTFRLIKATCTKAAERDLPIPDSSNSIEQALLNIPDDSRPDIIAFFTSLPQQRQIWATLKDLVNRISTDERFRSRFENLSMLELTKPERLGKRRQEQQTPETELRKILLGRLDKLLATRELVSLYQQRLDELDTEWLTACRIAEDLQLGYSVTRDRLSKDRRILQLGTAAVQERNKEEQGLLQASYKLVELESFPFPIESNAPPLTLEKIEKQARLALTILDKYNKLPEASNYGELLQAARFSLLMNREIQFVLPACPVLEPEQFKGTKPWKYISESAAGCNVLTNMPTTKQMFQELSYFRIPARLVIVVGDDDEEAYIFPITGTPEGIDHELVEARRQAQTEDLKERVTKKFPYRSRIERWTAVDNAPFPPFLPTVGSRIETLVEDMTRTPTKYFTQEEIQTEMERMNEILGYYWYQYCLLAPEEINADILQRITSLKLGHYGGQGAKISLKYPFSILLQIELPAVLRTKMLNIVSLNLNFIRPMPAIYPYAI